MALRGLHRGTGPGRLVLGVLGAFIRGGQGGKRVTHTLRGVGFPMQEGPRRPLLTIWQSYNYLLACCRFWCS